MPNSKASGAAASPNGGGRVGDATPQDDNMSDEENSRFVVPSKIGSPSLEMQIEERREKPEPGRRDIIWAVLLYAACSSTLILINAVAVRRVRDAPFVLLCQFVFSSVTVRGIRCSCPQIDVELITWEKGRPFLLACAVFFLCLLSNTEALESVNPETVIVARSCSPISVAVLERLTLGKALPNVRGIMSLFMIAGGAFVYVAADKGFKVTGYAWLAVYYVSIVVEMVFVKYVLETIPMSTWTRVYYNNTLSVPMALLSSMVLGPKKFLKANWDFGTLFAVFLSCTVGLAISYAGFNLRNLISATSFTVVGVVCKLITVLINDLMWENHSNSLGHLGLMICIGSGFAFERSKSRGK